VAQGGTFRLEWWKPRVHCSQIPEGEGQPIGSMGSGGHPEQVPQPVGWKCGKEGRTCGLKPLLGSRTLSRWVNLIRKAKPGNSGLW
jgi:hypothetical protein